MLVAGPILGAIAMIVLFNDSSEKVVNTKKKRKNICRCVQKTFQNGFNCLINVFTPIWFREFEEELDAKKAINMEQKNIVSELTSIKLNKQLISIYKYKQRFPNLISFLPEMEIYCAAISMLEDAKIERAKCLDALVRHSPKYHNSELADLPVIGADWDILEISTRQWVLLHGYYYCKNVYKDLLQEKIDKMKADLPKKPKNFTFIWKHTNNLLYIDSPNDIVTANISFPLHKKIAGVLSSSLAPFVYYNLENPDL